MRTPTVSMLRRWACRAWPRRCQHTLAVVALSAPTFPTPTFPTRPSAPFSLAAHPPAGMKVGDAVRVIDEGLIFFHMPKFKGGYEVPVGTEGEKSLS